MFRAQLLVMLAWVHAVVQERRTYIPQGWTKAYEFSFGDLRAGVSVIDALLEQAGAVTDPRAIPWKFVHGLMENAIYGAWVSVARAADQSRRTSRGRAGLLPHFCSSLTAGNGVC